MISCCAHYLVNLVPILGVTGLATFAAQYQVKLFWVGILFNVAGIMYMVNKIYKFKKIMNPVRKSTNVANGYNIIKLIF